MTADTFTTSNERVISGALAFVTHLLFFALIVFGVSWQQNRPSATNVVEIWDTLPPAAQPKREPVPEVKPEPPPPPPPQPAPKVEPPPEPKPVPKAEPKPEVKPDIALREKQEKERKAAEAKARAERRKQEQELAEKRRREREEQQIAALKAQQAREAKEAEARRRAAAEQEAALKKLAAEQAAAQSKLKNEYVQKIRGKVRRFIIEPPNLQGNPEVEMDVVVLPGGEVLAVKTRKGSGNSAYDNAVERAILKAQPLPLPPADSPLFKDFRELNLKFRPKE